MGTIPPFSSFKAMVSALHLDVCATPGMRWDTYLEQELESHMGRVFRAEPHLLHNPRADRRVKETVCHGAVLQESKAWEHIKDSDQLNIAYATLERKWIEKKSRGIRDPSWLSGHGLDAQKPGPDNACRASGNDGALGVQPQNVVPMERWERMTDVLDACGVCEDRWPAQRQVLESLPNFRLYGDLQSPVQVPEGVRLGIFPHSAQGNALPGWDYMALRLSAAFGAALGRGGKSSLPFKVSKLRTCL